MKAFFKFKEKAASSFGDCPHTYPFTDPANNPFTKYFPNRI